MTQGMLAGITWQGLLGAIGSQAVVVAALSAALRLPPRQVVRGFAYDLLADAFLAPVLLAIGASSHHLVHGSENRWLAIALLHCSAAATTSWLTWKKAARLSVPEHSSRAAGLLVIAAALSFCLPGVRWAWSRDPAQLHCTVLPLPGLPKELDGVRIALVSDLHVGRYLSVAEARRLMAPLRNVRADLTLFAGDLVSEEPKEIGAASRALEELSPAGPHFAVLGNHDHWTGADAVAHALESSGFRVLTNESACVTLRGVPVWLVGVDDASTGHARPEQAFQGVPPGACVLLLSHSPDIIGGKATGAADVVLSGHTHGGQIVLPLLGPLMGNSEYGVRHLSGLSHVGHSALFTTRGLGDVMVPMRLFCDPEIDVIELRASPSN